MKMWRKTKIRIVYFICKTTYIFTARIFEGETFYLAPGGHTERKIIGTVFLVTGEIPF